MDVKIKVKEFIVDELLEDESIEINSDTSLFSDRLLDSLNLLALIKYLEDEFSFKMDTIDITIENMDSLNLVERFLTDRGILG
jgi:acyl carrier protein